MENQLERQPVLLDRLGHSAASHAQKTESARKCQRGWAIFHQSLTTIHPPDSEHLKYAAELVSRFGREAVSFHGIKAAFDYWFTHSKDGCVAYVDTGSAWVALGSHKIR